MYSSNGLQLGTHAELGLDQQDVSSLHDVQAFGTRLEGQQEHIDVGTGTEGGEVALDGGI